MRRRSKIQNFVLYYGFGPFDLQLSIFFYFALSLSLSISVPLSFSYLDCCFIASRLFSTEIYLFCLEVKKRENY